MRRLIAFLALGAALIPVGAVGEIKVEDLPDIPVFSPTREIFKGAPKSLQQVAVNVINFVGLIAGVLAVLYTIWGGIVYLTAAGNPDRAKTGKDAIIHGVVGVAIISLSLLIVNLVIFGLKGK